MRNLISAVRLFFTRPVAIESLGLFRILVAAFALVQVIVLFPDWMTLYGPDGLLPWPLSDALSTTGTPAISDLKKLLIKTGITDHGALYLVTTIYIIALAGLLAGFNTRFMAIMAWLMHLMLNTTGHFTAYGVETFTHISLFYCLVLPVGSSWSYDAYKKPVLVPSELSTLYLRLLQLHLCIMYLASGLEKSMGSQWWNGEAIWIALQQDQFNQFDISWMASVPWVPKVLGWGTLVIETLYPVGIFCASTKKWWLGSILLMHAGIAVFLGLHLFGALMIILNVAIFGQHVFPALFSKRIRFPWQKNINYESISSSMYILTAEKQHKRVY